MWAAGIVRTVGLVNFLQDPSQNPHMKLTEVDDAFGVSKSTSQTKSMTIRTMLNVHEFDLEWTLPSRMDGNPLAWMVEVNGLVIDVRHAPRSIQEIAYQRGLIPHIPEIQQ